MLVYADGSATGGGVGASTVLFRNEERGVLRNHWGKENEHIIFEAEVMGLALAAKLVRAED